MGRGLLIREQVRQAILIAARDEMGLATRDAALREIDPADPDAIGVHLDVSFPKSSIDVQLLRGGKAVWSGRMVRPNKSTLHVNLTEACEPWSRRQFVEALTAAGFKPAPRPAAKAGDTPPDGVDALLAQMSFVAQVDAARRVHESIRSGGESPAKLAALVRAYGNLAALTERQWYAADRVFKARALLYAQRLVAGDVPTAHALWHRAYARAMAGLYGPAADDLAAAAKVADPARDGGPPPAWVPLLDMFCRYDVAGLKAAAAKDPAVAPLATFLAMLDLTGAAHGEIIAAGQLALAASPENFFALDRTNTEAGVSYNHSLTRMGPQILIGQTLAKTLPAMANLPDPVREKIKALTDARVAIDVARVAAVSQALVTAGDPNTDRGEPSLATVGRLIEDTHFLHIYRRATFVRDQLGGDAGEVGEFVRSQLPLIGAGHPYRAFLEHFGVDYRQDPAKYDELLTSVKPVDPTPPVRQWLGYFKDSPKTRAFKNQQADRLYQFTDYVIRDEELQYQISNQPTWRTALANQMLRISPRSPFAMGLLVANEWETRQAKAAEYETWAPGVAYLQGVLAAKYAGDERLEDAARCYQAYLAISKEWWIYKRLADLHLKRGDEAMWLKTLETYLREGEDYSLTFASTRVEIARELSWRGKYRQALPYAVAAADTGAGWALTAAAECHEALGEFDRAEPFYRSAAGYASGSFQYWLWCWRRGNGGPEMAQAERAVLDYIAGNKVVDEDTAATFYLLKGDRDAALKLFRGIGDATLASHVGIHMALAADEAGDAALRDQALERVSKQLRATRTRSYFVQLAKQFKEALASPAKGLDPKKLDEFIGKYDRETQVYLNEMVGRFLLLHGDKTVAQKYLRAAIRVPTLSYNHVNLAWYALKGQGLDPRTLRDPVKD
jgi:tetratricopeptide (TPR) repeat protein